ncbi:MAG: FAD-binding oxidoreductase [Deltaproteobacteria bacterium]|nr:FAD-binding oxidoreductase [Deltaproteobacteria bacterium]
MKNAALEQIKQRFGRRATDSPFECSLYSRDMAPVPAFLVNPLFNTLPEMIVRPADAEEAAEILKLAFANHIPVTPRAGASTVYFNSVPVRGGIVMDLNLIKGVVGLDEYGMTVTVKAGTTWRELDEYLNPLGFALKSFPSSAPSASIGGWFSMMGYGIGSMKYGSLLSQVRAVEAVLPTGDIRRLTRDTDPPLEWFAASEGTLGVITRLEVEIRKLSPMKHFLLAFPDAGKMDRALEAVIHAPVIPYNVHFADDRFASAMHSLGFFPIDSAPAHTLGIDYEGGDAELKTAQDMVAALVGTDYTIRLFSAETAEREWAEKFNALRLKRGGPSVLGSEIWLPVNVLSGYLSDIRKMANRYEIDLISYGHVVAPDRATVMTMFYTDETKTIAYILDLSLVKKIHDVGRRHGGCPYGVGLWNTPYLGRMFTSAHLNELRRRKRMLDSRGIMNPGKVYRSPALLNPFNFAAGMEVLAAVRRVAGRSGHG